MKPHPDFADVKMPRQVRLGDFDLTPLAPQHVAEDFEAVTQSEPVLIGLFGDTWPSGLTLEENAIDLAWHEREFTAGRSFSWIIRDREGHYLGCAYLFPTLGERGVGEVYTWMRDLPNRITKLVEFNSNFKTWLIEQLPVGYRFAVKSND